SSSRCYRSSLTFILCAPEDLGQVREAIEQPGGELLRLETPAPVAHGTTWKVHARLAPQAQQVLHWGDRIVRRRRPREPNDVPGDVLAVARHVAANVVLFLFRSALIPATGGVVVVGPGVDHRVALFEIVRQVTVGGRVGKREL